jgi:hypothetical protein
VRDEEWRSHCDSYTFGGNNRKRFVLEAASENMPREIKRDRSSSSSSKKIACNYLSFKKGVTILHQ